jgi:hypothetical protein
VEVDKVAFVKGPNSSNSLDDESCPIQLAHSKASLENRDELVNVARDTIYVYFLSGRPRRRVADDKRGGDIEWA